MCSLQTSTYFPSMAPTKPDMLVATVDDVLAVLEASKYGDYLGEDISQLEHCLQAADLATRNGDDDETVIAALLHDIGQILPVDSQRMLMSSGGNVGRVGHETIGARPRPARFWRESVHTSWRTCRREAVSKSRTRLLRET